MSEPNTTPLRQRSSYTLIFMTVLSLVCAVILSILASALREPQEQARELDRSKQLLIAARILSPFGYFQVQDSEGNFVPAKIGQGGVLEPSDRNIFPSQSEILDVYRDRIRAFLVNDQGEETTFQKAKLDEQAYVQDFRKTGYYREPLKLIYKIFSNSKPGEEKDRQIDGYVFPVNGMGLWDAIYGYLAIKPDGDTVIGISWYDQRETPGLGANITEADWQSQFPDKRIFQESSDGTTDFVTAPLGITVVKGRVNEVLGTSPRAKSAVDGMAGATLTGNGVTDAYRNVLTAYRPFLIKLHEEFKKSKEGEK